VVPILGGLCEIYNVLDHACFCSGNDFARKKEKEKKELPK
jgi:hypothetical protein